MIELYCYLFVIPSDSYTASPHRKPLILLAVGFTYVIQRAGTSRSLSPQHSMVLWVISANRDPQMRLFTSDCTRQSR